jgi:cytoskeletal protein CcmA (bactofilin family)
MSNPYDNANATIKSVLGPTLKFKGELTAEEDLLIQGEVEGSIKHTSTLRIGKEGTVKANVTAEYISVEGKVKGDLTGNSSVKVHESAEIEGNIYSPSVSLLEGATFNGSVDMSGNGKSQSMPAPKAEQPPVEAESSNKKDVKEAVSEKKEKSEESSDRESKSANAA